VSVYYNEFDPHAAEWLRNLMADGLIPAGVVDERSIVDVQAEDLAGFTQCHFFAGIGGWPLALQLAGWPDDREVWTGSCPCQPFSTAGKRQGTKDARHLWPEFARLIAQCHPATVFGEQVASRAGRDWLAGVRVDLETLGYGVGGADLCAAGVGAPHIRQRLFWVGDAGGTRGRRHARTVPGAQTRSARKGEAARRESHELESPGTDRRLGQPTRRGDGTPPLCGGAEEGAGARRQRGARGSGALGRLADGDRERQPEWTESNGGSQAGQQAPRRADTSGRRDARRVADAASRGDFGSNVKTRVFREPVGNGANGVS